MVEKSVEVRNLFYIGGLRKYVCLQNKGQLIYKGIFGILNFSKKKNEKIRYTVKSRVLTRVTN